MKQKKRKEKRKAGTHLSHGDDGVFTPVPDSLDVDVLGEIPDLFFRDEGVVVGGVHDACVVELWGRRSWSWSWSQDEVRTGGQHVVRARKDSLESIVVDLP